MGKRYYRSRKKRYHASSQLIPTSVIIGIAVFVLFLYMLSEWGNVVIFIVVLGIAVVAGGWLSWSWWLWRRRRRRQHSLQLSDIDHMPGHTFEHYVADLLKHQGYTQVVVTPPNNDFGADILCQHDDTTIAVQVKRHSGYIGVAALYQALGGRDYYQKDVAMVITNSFFSYQAIELASKASITLIDRYQLADWITAFRQDL